MTRLKVKKGKIPFRALLSYEKESFQEIVKILNMAELAIKNIIDNAPATPEQMALMGTMVKEPLFKSKNNRILEDREAKARRQAHRRQMFGGPDPQKKAEQGVWYAVQSYMEPLAAVARANELDDFITLLSGRKSEEERQAEIYRDSRTGAKIQLWQRLFLKYRNDEGLGEEEAEEALSKDPEWQAITASEDLALEYYQIIKDKWEKKRLVVYKARKAVELFAKEDRVPLLLPDPVELWSQARA